MYMNIVLDKFVEGRDCYRCGISRSESRQVGVGCYVGYGKWYDRHLFTAKSAGRFAPKNHDN